MRCAKLFFEWFLIPNYYADEVINDSKRVTFSYKLDEYDSDTKLDTKDIERCWWNKEDYRDFLNYAVLYKMSCIKKNSG